MSRKLIYRLLYPVEKCLQLIFKCKQIRTFVVRWLTQSIILRLRVMDLKRIKLASEENVMRRLCPVDWVFARLESYLIASAIRQVSRTQILILHFTRMFNFAQGRIS